MSELNLRRRLLLILVLVAVNLIFVRMGRGGLAAYDDAYYAEKAKEMLVHQSPLTVLFDNRPSFDNPPGLFWLIGGSYKIFGVNAFAAAFPSAVAGLLGILGTFFLFELLFSTRIGFLAAIILTLTSLYLKYSRKSMMDVEVTACTLWCYYCFFKGLRGWKKGFVLAGLIGSYSLFMKSVLGVVPALVPFAYLILTAQWRPFRDWRLWLGGLLLFLPYGGWVAYEYHLFGQAFINGHYGMILGLMSDETSGHIYDYAITLLKYFPIWLPFMIWGVVLVLKKRGDEKRTYWFPLVYFAVYFVLLSLQKTTKDWYFIPAFPACACLAAFGLDRVLRRWDLPKIARGYAVLGILFYLVFHMTNISLSKEREVNVRLLAPYVRAAADQGFHLLGYEYDFYGLNNPLLFYSDHSAQPVKADDLTAQLAMKSKTALLIDAPKWSEVHRLHPEFQVVKDTGEMILATTAPLASEKVFSFNRE